MISSADYWEERYAAGGNSGSGSAGENAAFKASFLNGFVAEYGIETVLELGCGDGRQLALAEYPSYVGVDPSETALGLCRERFADDTTKEFLPITASVAPADLTLSLDVAYHLVEDDVYLAHLDLLFGLAKRFAVIYTFDLSQREHLLSAPHIRYRYTFADISDRYPQFRLHTFLPNPAPELEGADFYVYERVA